MSDGKRQPDLRILVIGAFRVIGLDGADLTPHGRKARALLAILALTPTRRRSRTALQDKLWSNRGPKQAAESLRQALSEIRRTFGARYRRCLVTDMRGIGLIQDEVSVDIDTAEFAELAQTVEPPQLLDDLDVADDAFEAWLLQQRAAFEQRLTSLKGTATHRAFTLGLEAPSGQGDAVARPWLRLLPSLTVASEGGSLLCGLVADRIAQGLVDHWAIHIGDDGKGPQGVQLRVDTLAMSRDVTINVVLISANGATRLWSGTATISLEQSFVLNSPRLQALINRSIEITGSYLSRIGSSSDASCAFIQAFDAVQRMFRLDLEEVDRADALLASAYELDAKAVYLAWRSFARIFYVGEHIKVDRRLAIAQSEELARGALDADPHNATVLALVSYVYSFILRNYELGHELAKLSVKSNPAHPLGHAFLGRAKSYLGEHESGYAETCRALEQSGQGPYRYMLHTLCGMTALLSGRFEEAVRASEIACALAPSYRPPLRSLVPLYLRTGEREKARATLEKLHRLEPTFSLDAMRETAYPSAGIRASGLLNFSDRDL